ncbi:MAG: SHOCT domain-containing protein [Acidimicrobiales bacterium]|jgi:hypothetical protein
MSTADEIAKLNALRQSGALTDAEFEAEKSKLLAASSPAPPAATAASPTAGSASAKKPPNRRAGIGCLTFIVLAVVIGIIVAVSGGSSGPSANVKGKVVNVVALNGNTVRIYMDWTNSGKAAGSASCVLNTNVDDQFGDQVNIEVNSTATNGKVAAGATQRLYQDIGVNSGDAQFIKPSDVKITDCS